MSHWPNLLHQSFTLNCSIRARMNPGQISISGISLYLLSSSPSWGTFWVCSADTGSGDSGQSDSFCCRGKCKPSSFALTSWRKTCSLKNKKTMVATYFFKLGLLRFVQLHYVHKIGHDQSWRWNELENHKIFSPSLQPLPATFLVAIKK